MKLYVYLIIVCAVLLKLGSPTNVILKKLDICEGTNNPNTVKLRNIKHLGNYVHSFDFSAKLVSDLGDNTNYKALFFRNNRKLPITFGGKNACKAGSSILGEIFFMVINKCGVKACPIPKGDYSCKNITADLKKMKLQLPVKGEFRVDVPITDNSDKAYACLQFLAEL